MELWKRNLYLCWAAQMSGMIGFAMVMPFFPLYIHELGVKSEEEAATITGLMTTLSFVVMAIVSPIWGALGDRYGRKSMMTRAMFGGFFLVGGMFFVTEVWQLFVLRVAQGAFTGTVPAAVALVASLTPQKRMGFSLGLMQTAVFSGQTIGPLIGGIMGDLTGHRVMFGFSGVLLLIGGLIIQFGVKEDFVPPIKEPGSTAFGNFMEGIMYTVKQKEVLIMALVLALSQFTFTIISPIMPFFINRIGTLGGGIGVSSTIGIIVGIVGIVSAVSAFVLGRYSDRWGHRRMLIISAFFSFVFYLPQAFVTTALQLVILRAGTGLFAGGIVPAANAIISNQTPKEKRGAIYGLVNSISALGLAAGPVTGSTLATAFDVRWVFVIVALAMLAITALVWLTVRPSIPVKEDDRRLKSDELAPSKSG